MERRPVNRSRRAAKWPGALHTAAPRSPDPQVTSKPRLNQRDFMTEEHGLGNVRGRWELERRARPGNCCQLWYVSAKDGRRLESCPGSPGLGVHTQERRPQNLSLASQLKLAHRRPGHHCQGKI